MNSIGHTVPSQQSASVPGTPVKQQHPAAFVDKTNVNISSPYRYAMMGPNDPRAAALKAVRRPNSSSHKGGGMESGSGGEEKWIDGPKMSRAKVVEARHMMREIHHVKTCETWIDGPKMVTPTKVKGDSSLIATKGPAGVYGFMDNHKKSMIRQWVENQTSQVLQAEQQKTLQSSTSARKGAQRHTNRSTPEKHPNAAQDGERAIYPSHTIIREVNDDFIVLEQTDKTGFIRSCSKHSIKSTAAASEVVQTNAVSNDEEDQDSGPSEVPPALPLLDCLGSAREGESLQRNYSSHHMSREESVNGDDGPIVKKSDYGLQVSEEDIAKSMHSDQYHHPLSALSHGDMSVVSSFRVGDTFSDCAIGDTSR